MSESKLPEGVTARTVYLARDGREFYSVASAILHNEDLALAQAANAVLLRGGSVYEAAKAAGRPGEAEILKRVTADTMLVIDHWQCRETPGYKVIRFESPWRLYVGGDAGPPDNRPYGDSVDLRDLVRYAESTFRRFPDPRPCPLSLAGEA